MEKKVITALAELSDCGEMDIIEILLAMWKDADRGAFGAEVATVLRAIAERIEEGRG